MNYHVSSVEHISRILRTHPEQLSSLIAQMERITHRTGVLEAILEENERYIEKARTLLKVPSTYAEDITVALEEVIARDDKTLFAFLGSPDLGNPQSTRMLEEKAYEVARAEEKGFFLKKEKARQMLLETPPEAMIQGLGYRDAEELLEKERLEEVFAALRFIETREWMNTVFVKAYEKLTPEDFEERSLELLILPKKWLTLAEKFLEKKYHNVSHLKELGVIFIIPIQLDITGETLRFFSLILHYLHEVVFYSKLIKQYAADPVSFAARVMSLIRGDVGAIDAVGPLHPARWLIVQRYLAKDDEGDPRLFLAHVNPEALHWRKAERDLAHAFHDHDSLQVSMFCDLDYVGDFFPSRKIGELFLSFDLVDNIMGLVMNEAMVKYLYHHQEALWNRIFVGFVGEERMEELILANLDKGYIEVASL